jgi:hypothetical protein
MSQLHTHQYGKTATKDCNANQQCMAAVWRPANGFDALILRRFTGAAYASSMGFKMNDVIILNIGLRIIKQCGMYSEEYKAWIACEAIRPCIVKTVDMFKTFWAAKITLVNQTTIPASMHGYGIAAVNNNDSVVLHGELIANFGAAYAATQESVKSQGTTAALLQGQMQAMQQYCMALGLQPPPLASTCCSNNSMAATVHHINLQPAAEEIQPRHRTNNPEDFLAANAHCSNPPRSRGLKIGTTAICMAGTSTTPTLTCPAITQVRHTTRTRQGEYNGRQYGGPTQDNSAFRFWSRPTCPTSATSPCSYNVAATPASCEFYSDDGGDASNDAGNPPPGHQLHGLPAGTSPSAVWTSLPCCCAACAPSCTTCGNDDAVLQSVPAASTLLMVRGEQS